MRRVYLIMVTGLAMILATAAFAREGRVNKRQKRQDHRIQQGVESGALNEREAKRLNRQQDRIEKYEEESRSDDGKLDRKERHKLSRMQNRASRKIRREKHDRQKQPREENEGESGSDSPSND